jgi:hypothetical protein
MRNGTGINLSQGRKGNCLVQARNQRRQESQLRFICDGTYPRRAGYYRIWGSGGKAALEAAFAPAKCFIGAAGKHGAADIVVKKASP